MSIKDCIKKQYNINNISNDQLKYFYKNNTWCCEFNNIDVYIDNIDKYDYIKLAQQILKFYKDAEHNKFIIDFAKEIVKFGKKNIFINNKILYIDDNIYLNYLILYYIQCRKNIKILISFPNNITDIEEQLIKSKCDIYAIKKIKITTKSSLGLLYQIYSRISKTKYNLNLLKQLSKNLGWINETNINEITVYIYEENDTNFILNNNHFTTYITDTFYDAIVLAKLLFNENSINFLEDQRLDRFLSIEFNKCKNLLNTFTNYIYNNIKLFDLDKFLILSGSVLYTYGVRNCTDVDFFIGDYPSKIMTDNYYEKIDKNFLNNNTKFFFVDAYTKKYGNGKYWNDFYKTWHYEWANMFGSEHISETIFNPKYHYYFMGLKILILDADIARRNVRYRPAAIADLIMINKLLGKSIKINKIKKTSLKLGKIKKIKPSIFINIIKNYLQKKYNVQITHQQLNNLIQFE